MSFLLCTSRILLTTISLGLYYTLEVPDFTFLLVLGGVCVRTLIFVLQVRCL